MGDGDGVAELFYYGGVCGDGAGGDCVCDDTVWEEVEGNECAEI